MVEKEQVEEEEGTERVQPVVTRTNISSAGAGALIDDILHSEDEQRCQGRVDRWDCLNRRSNESSITSDHCVLKRNPIGTPV